MTSVVRTYERDGLIIDVSRASSSAVITWRGISDSRNPADFLNPIIQELSAMLKGLEVTIDFTPLKYINSATVAPLIRLVRALDTTCKRVQVLFSNSDWQQTHFRCMCAIGRTLKHVGVEIAGQAPGAGRSGAQSS